MPETDMLSLLRLINEKICSQQVETRHRDILIRLREILENDLNGVGLIRPSDENYDSENKAV
jgi:hypothetical protein